MKEPAERMILVVCTGNTCRSPMAAALFRRTLQEREEPFRVVSAGLAATGEPASEGARQVMAEWGIDLAAHRSQPVTAELCRQAERIYVMSPWQGQALQAAFGVPEERIRLLGDGIPDPFGGDAELYRRTRDSLEQAIRQEKI